MQRAEGKIERVHMIVHGRVHGVTFRESTRYRASELDLVGVVRNLMDGTVEIIAEGPKSALNKLVQWACSGPSASRVDRVDVEFETAGGEYRSFSVDLGY